MISSALVIIRLCLQMSAFYCRWTLSGKCLLQHQSVVFRCLY